MGIDGGDPSPSLGAPWSELALALFADATVAETSEQVVRLAAAAVAGCQAAGILVVDGGAFTTPACTDPLVADLDGMQITGGAGPSLTALDTARPCHADDLAEDRRWPAFAPAAAAAGIRSVIALPLPARRPTVLTLYARPPRAFDASDQAEGLIFATLAGIALTAAEDRTSNQRRFGNLEDALRTREMIGQAQGILMERKRITADEAFDLLRCASQRVNKKLRDVAASVVQTGEVPSAPGRSLDATA